MLDIQMDWETGALQKRIWGCWLTACWVSVSSCALAAQRSICTLRCTRPSAATGRGEGLSSALCCVASPTALGAVWVPQYKNNIKLLESIQRTATRMMKGPEGKVWEQAELPGFAQPRTEELRGGLIAAAAPHGERRGSAELCSLWQPQGWENSMEVCQGRDSWEGTG